MLKEKFLAKFTENLELTFNHKNRFKNFGNFSGKDEISNETD